MHFTSKTLHAHHTHANTSLKIETASHSTSILIYHN